jgi:hypothetical protein
MNLPAHGSKADNSGAYRRNCQLRHRPPVARYDDVFTLFNCAKQFRETIPGIRDRNIHTPRIARTNGLVKTTAFPVRSNPFTNIENSSLCYDELSLSASSRLAF